MFRTSIAVAAVAVLGFCAAAAAQSSSQEQGSAATSQNQVERTTGQVVSNGETMLVIKSDTGEEKTFQIDAGSLMPPNLQPGQQVTVAYHANPENADQPIISKVDISDPSTSASTQSSRSPQQSASSTQSTGSTKASAGNSEESASETARSRLPQTASPLPLVALAGLAALGGFLALKPRA